MSSSARVSGPDLSKYPGGEALYRIRHSAAHVLATAVTDLFPETKVAGGPPIDNGFYYDFAKPTPFTPEDLEKIEARMRQASLLDGDAPAPPAVVDDTADPPPPPPAPAAPAASSQPGTPPPMAPMAPPMPRAVVVPRPPPPAAPPRVAPSPMSAGRINLGNMRRFDGNRGGRR